MRPAGTRLSPHFTLAELTRTSQGTDNTPAPRHLERLRLLAERVLEPLRERFGPLRVTSAYRSAATNRAIYAAISRRRGRTVRPNMRSQHLTGDAADVVPLRPGVTVADMIAWLAESDVPFDQAIDERDAAGRSWLHVSQAPAHRPPRRQALIWREGRGYKPWQPDTAEPASAPAEETQT